MKILKYSLAVIAILLAIFLLLAFFAPNRYSVERQVTIKKSKQEVFDYIVLLKNQDNFSVWANMDTQMKKTYKGEDGKVGFVSAWESKLDDVGKGEQEILKIVGNERIEYELRFIEPFEANDLAYMQLSEISPTETTVTWGFKGEMAFPMNIFLLFMDMEKQLGGDLQKGLDNLKTVLEK